MRRAIRSHYVWLCLGLFATFWVCAAIVPLPIMLLLSNSFLLCASFAVSVAYVPVAWRAVRTPHAPKRAIAISLGIVFGWGFGFLWRIISLLWLTSGQPAALVNNDIIAMLQGGSALAACFHLTAVDDRIEGSPTMQWGLISLIIVVAGAVAAGLAIVHPDMRWLTTIIIPYLPV